MALFDSENSHLTKKELITLIRDFQVRSSLQSSDEQILIPTPAESGANTLPSPLPGSMDGQTVQAPGSSDSSQPASSPASADLVLDSVSSGWEDGSGLAAAPVTPETASSAASPSDVSGTDASSAQPDAAGTVPSSESSTVTAPEDSPNTSTHRAWAQNSAVRDFSLRSLFDRVPQLSSNQDSATLWIAPNSNLSDDVLSVLIDAVNGEPISPSALQEAVDNGTLVVTVDATSSPVPSSLKDMISSTGKEGPEHTSLPEIAPSTSDAQQVQTVVLYNPDGIQAIALQPGTQVDSQMVTRLSTLLDQALSSAPLYDEIYGEGASLRQGLKITENSVDFLSSTGNRLIRRYNNTFHLCDIIQRLQSHYHDNS